MASGINKKENLLTIAIPTFNRAGRLEESLKDLLSQIIESKRIDYLSVFVSNNGSTDETVTILDRYSVIFKENNIPFNSQTLNENLGFDANVLNCYRNCNTEYVWFLSDDDNIIDGAINSIIEDIQNYSPNVLYYNFDQYPNDKKNPNIKKSILYHNVNEGNIQSIGKIINDPKLTSLIIKKMNGEAGEKCKSLNFYYIQIALALQTGFDYGKIYHSEIFIARPDNNYMDQIDFLPFIANGLIETVRHVFKQNNKMHFYPELNLKMTDPLISCILNLTQYYLGNRALTTELKSRHYKTILNEFKNIKIRKLARLILIKSIIMLFISYFYNFAHLIIRGRSAAKIRK